MKRVALYTLAFWATAATVLVGLLVAIFKLLQSADKSLSEF